MESDDELEFMKQINQPEVKQEEPDQEGEQANSKEGSPDEAGSSEGPSGIADLLETLDAVTEKEDDEVEKWNHMLVEKEPKRRRGGGGGSRESKEDDRKQFEEPKAPLTTFGHSARPRRSVNYASIERGDEAQAQSLVTEFRSSTNKRQKRTRDELDENYVEEPENGRPAGRKRRTAGGGQKSNGQYQPPGSAANSTLAVGRALLENKTAIDEYMQFVPKPTDEQPTGEARKFGTMLEQLPAIKRSSGGFRKFISKIGDKSVLDLAGIVQRRCIVEADDHMLLRSLRHIYNSMPMSYRRDFEYQARMDFHASRMFVPHLSMPLSEILVTDPSRPPPRMLRDNEVRVNCCSLRPIVSDMCQVIEHYLQFHDIVHFFGCDFCLKVFSSRYDLTKHDCKEFGDHMYSLISLQKTLSLSAAYMYLTCSQCGLWLSVKASVAGQKGWTYFATAVKNHSCKALIPILVYFREGVPEEGKNVRMQFQIMSTFDTGIPMSCSECGIEEFKTLKEIEDHFKEKHEPKTCSKCQKQFGTEFSLRQHSITHYSQSLQLANHLVHTATYHPPPASGRPPHVGFKSNVAAVGGFTANEIQAMETMEKSMNTEFVGADENTIRKKVFRWKRKKSDKKENRENSGEFTREPGESSGEEEFQKRLKAQEQEASSSDSEESQEDVGSGNRNSKKLVKRTRGDLGYEHIDRNAMFERSEAEKEARKRIEKMLGANVFMTRERLLEPEEALEILKHAETVNLPTLVCSIADEIAVAAMKTITMPLTNCIDPLKDILLVNKIYVYCGKCNSVVNSDIATHSAKCDVPEDSLIEIYHGASGPHAGVHCIVPGCEAHLCSVIALRSHANTVHNLKMSIPSANDEVPDAFQQTRYDRSMMQLAKHFHGLQKDQRTHLARMTDIDCLLPFTGLLDSKMQPRHQPPPSLPRQAPVSNPPTQRQAPALQLAPGRPVLAGSTLHPSMDVPMKVPQFRTPYVPNPPNSKIASRCKPFHLPRNTRWYKCSWCTKDYENLDLFVDHLVKYHVHVCSNCGKGYATSNTKRVHVCTNAIAENRPSGMTSSGTCPTCREIFPIDIVYTHMLRRHFSTIEFIQATGEMLPQIRDMLMRPVPVPSVQRNFPQSIRDHAAAPGASANGTADPRLNQISVGLAPVYGVDIQRLPPRDPPFNSIAICPADYKNVDMRLMCYICELTYDNINELTTHLDEHPERWTHCPFCEDHPVPVDGHYELQKHFMTKHVVKISGALCCAHCQESHRFMSSHLLYRCKKISKCSICGQKSPDATANRVHMQRSHIQALRRFQCTYCPKVFTSVGEYYEHKCSNPHRHIYACECQPIKFFNTPSEYCDHFDSVHIQRNHCKLCGIQAPTQEAMIRHRPSHMKTQPAREPQRKLHLLMKSLYPKDDSGYMRWVRGGEPPTSFVNVDRTGRTFMMGTLGQINMAAVPTYRSQSPRTLFDALEGPAARNRNVVGTCVGGGPRAKVVTVTPKNPTSNNDVVMLSDDEDCMVFDPVTVEKNTNNVATSSSTSQIDRTVRVEQSSDGYGTVKAPGYVDEDDAELEVRKSPSGGEPVVKEIIDENGDDELAVVAEVENSAGTLPSNVSAGREKKFKCTKCSKSFYTNSSLQYHAEKDHRQDAGGTVCCLETYGLPKTTKAAYLCRNCSIVFEDQAKQIRHMQQHGETTLPCADCGGIAFNYTALNHHLQAHRDKKVHFACGRCLVRFPTDLALMEHLKLTHETELFYFCKICALGSTNPDYVYQHITTHTGHHFTLVQRIGAVPVQLLNYEPTNEKEFAMKVLQKTIQLHTPSDCTHRSMLVQADTLVTCKTCHCFQQWFNYMACNKHSEETGYPTFANMEPYADHRKDFPLIRYLSEKNRSSMLRFGNVKAIPGMLPHPQQQQRYNSVLRPLAPQLENPNVTQRNPNIQANAPIGINGGAPVVSMTSGGARVIHPAQQNMAAQRPSPAAQAQPTRRFVVNNRGNPATPPVAQAQPVSLMRNHIATSTKCKYSGCDKLLYSEFDRHLHTMHESETMWFCRQCGNSQKSEIDLFLHYVREHLTPAHAKQQATGFKSNVFKLRCPLCQKLEFQSPKAFEKHIRTEHAAEFPFEASCCDARFAVKHLCDQHDRKHTEFLEANGTDAMCCPICGSLDMWSLPKDQTTDCLQSHMIRHGLDYRSSCRSCLKQFPADIYQTIGIEHIREEHCFVNSETKQVVCRLCGQTGMTDEQFADHCRKSHLFNILVKSSHSTRGELVVSTGDEYENYTGLKQSKLAGRSRPSTSGAGGSVNIAAALADVAGPTNGEAEIYTID